MTGPRQTGKTTLVRQALAKQKRAFRYIAVDEPTTEATYPSIPAVSQALDAYSTDPTRRDTRWLIEQWEMARSSADGADGGFVLILDEIQKIDRWSVTVKGLWDADQATTRNLHVVLLGSSPLLMQKGLTESLAGRFEVIRLTHWSFLEMADAFSLDLPRYLYFGGYPGSAPFMRDEPRWRDYIRTGLVEPNIDKDVLMMNRVDKPALLKRLFHLGCDYSGQILSYTKMQGQLQDAGNTTTLAHYLELLSNAGLLTGLQKYAGHQHRRRASSPKLNILNTSLMSTESGYSFEQAKADRTFWGRLVESAVGAHLYNTGYPQMRLYYWRESPREVDFILELGGRTIAIEVKSAASGGSVPGLDLFEERFGAVRTLLVGSDGIPLEEFLTYPASHWFD